MTETKVFNLMQTGKPLKSYIKTVPSKVYVNVFDEFTGKPDGMILEGNPKTEDEDCIVDVWTDQADVYFKRANRVHFEKGVLIPFVRKEKIVVSDEEKYNSLSDEEMTELLNSKWYSLQAAVNKMTSLAPVHRMLTLAKELEKSEKITKFLEGRLAEIDLENRSVNET